MWGQTGIVDYPVTGVVYREDLYPRIKADPALIQRYAENLEMLPPIELNQDGILIDGFHRWTAHRKAEASTIPATITQTMTDLDIYALAIERNARHGLQLSEEDKRKTAIRLYAAGTGKAKDEIARILSVSLRSVTGYLGDIDKRLREERRQKIFEMWMACHTLEEIAQEVNISDSSLTNEIKTFSKIGSASDFGESLSFEKDADFKPPLYNIWTFAAKTNNVSHFGNSEARIVDNLLYLHTDPFDIVLDPFAGGGATIDVCRHRLRRYWVSDRAPIVEREREIRCLDIVKELPPLHNRWSDVTLTYLDPPYWRQAENQYSDSPDDLANMPLDQFNEALSSVVRRIAEKQSRGVIALIIQPTQWKTNEAHDVTDHIIDLTRLVGKTKRLTLEMRVLCPYPTEQYNAQQVTWAKENKRLLVLTRELIIWRING